MADAELRELERRALAGDPEAQERFRAAFERRAPAGGIITECLDTTWQTPPELVDRVGIYWGGVIPFDVATVASNPTKAAGFFTEEDDGLKQTWPRRVWVNPPYGKVIREWLLKMEREARDGCEIVSLLPCARWEQGYFQHSFTAANLLCLIRKRVAFIQPLTGDRVAGNPYANMLVGWNCDRARWVHAFAPVGGCLAIERLSGPPGYVAIDQQDLFAPPLVELPED